jgi:hypothetical protein
VRVSVRCHRLFIDAVPTAGGVQIRARLEHCTVEQDEAYGLSLVTTHIWTDPREIRKFASGNGIECECEGTAPLLLL